MKITQEIPPVVTSPPSQPRIYPGRWSSILWYILSVVSQLIWASAQGYIEIPRFVSRQVAICMTRKDFNSILALSEKLFSAQKSLIFGPDWAALAHSIDFLQSRFPINQNHPASEYAISSRSGDIRIWNPTPRCWLLYHSCEYTLQVCRYLNTILRFNIISYARYPIGINFSSNFFKYCRCVGSLPFCQILNQPCYNAFVSHIPRIR